MPDDITYLEKLIRSRSYVYYNGEVPPDNPNYLKDEDWDSVSDEEYDALVDKLRSLKPDSQALVEVGAPPSKNGTRAHRFRMYSLNKAKIFEEFRNGFYGKFPNATVIMSDKYDGCALEIYYCNGKLQHALTRGDGEYGQVVTNQVKAISNVPDEIPMKTPLWVYGEAVMNLRFYEKSGLSKEFTNVRNLVNGTMRPDADPKLVEEREIEFFLYGYNKINYSKNGYMKGFLSDAFHYLHVDQGFDIVNYTRHDLTKDNEVEVMKSLYDMTISNRNELDYQVDGKCVFLNDREQSQELGWTGHHPRFAVAIKFPSEGKEVELKNIRWDISNNGTLTPVAEFDPVELSGAMVSNCTLHNYGQVRDNNLYVGVKIFVQRSGDVIPYFKEVVSRKENDKDFYMSRLPLGCPYCGEDTKIDENGVKLYCPNMKCEEQIVMQYELQLDRLDHKGLAGQQIRTLLNNHSEVESFYGLWTIPIYHMQGSLGYGQGQKIYNSLHEHIKNVPLWRAIYHLNIHMVGKRASKKFASYFKTWDKFLRISHGDIYPALGYSADKMYMNIAIWQKNELDNNIVREMETAGFKIIDEVELKQGALKICFTGMVSRPRKEFEKFITDSGHIFVNSVTKDLNYLVTNEEHTSKKCLKAQKYNVKIITEEEFIEIINGR